MRLALYPSRVRSGELLDAHKVTLSHKLFIGDPPTLKVSRSNRSAPEGLWQDDQVRLDNNVREGRKRRPRHRSSPGSEARTRRDLEDRRRTECCDDPRLRWPDAEQSAPTDQTWSRIEGVHGI